MASKGVIFILTFIWKYNWGMLKNALGLKALTQCSWSLMNMDCPSLFCLLVFTIFVDMFYARFDGGGYQLKLQKKYYVNMITHIIVKQSIFTQ